jgi:hypothetical protein
MTVTDTPIPRPRVLTDLYSPGPMPWHVRAERQRQAQHRLDVAAAYRGARLLHRAQALAVGGGR